DKQSIQRLPALAERCCRQRHARRGHDALVTLRHELESVGRRAAGVGDEIIGGREHLNRPGDVEQLHRREGEHLDRPDRTWVPDRAWRGTRWLWHFRQTMPG